jgi:hypothetical protein
LKEQIKNANEKGNIIPLKESFSYDEIYNAIVELETKCKITVTSASNANGNFKTYENTAYKKCIERTGVYLSSDEYSFLLDNGSLFS